MKRINNEILSIDYDDNDEIDLKTFESYLADDTNRKKNQFIKELEFNGDVFVNEIDKKKINLNLKKKKIIPYILKHYNKYNTIEVDYDELFQYEYDDLRKIYDDIKERRKFFLFKFFNFLFNLK